MGKVLILSNKDEDAHIAGLVAELNKLGYPWVLFDPGDFPHQVQFSASFYDGEKRSSIIDNGVPIYLEEIDSVWYRRPSPITPSADLPDLERTFIEREANAGIWGWLRGVDALWVNHIDAIRAAGHKPQQLQLACSLGLSVPPTIITNDAEAFRAFYEECHGKVIYKLMGYP